MAARSVTTSNTLEQFRTTFNSLSGTDIGDLASLGTTATSITVNVGINPDGVYAHKFVSSSNNSINWAHNIKAGQSVSIDTSSLVWTCAMNSHATDHPYPRATDP